jgi:hypothetical protein
VRWGGDGERRFGEMLRLVIERVSLEKDTGCAGGRDPGEGSDWVGQRLGRVRRVRSREGQFVLRWCREGSPFCHERQKEGLPGRFFFFFPARRVYLPKKKPEVQL